jgi:Protein of unknown function (DUF2726)
MNALFESPVIAALAGLLLVAVLLLVVGRLFRRRKGPVPQRGKKADPTERRLESVDTVAGWPPQATRMLSQPERRAMALLRDALPDYMILAQVPLARFLKVPERYSYADWMRRVGHVSVDFLVCDLSANVIAAVELRDTDSDESDKARRRHMRMDRVLAAAGIKVHVWRDANLPQIATARDLILGAAAGSANAARQRAGKAGAVPLYDEVNDFEGRDEAADPRASSWFDELQPTQPTPLDPSTRH